MSMKVREKIENAVVEDRQAGRYRCGRNIFTDADTRMRPYDSSPRRRSGLRCGDTAAA
jgi:hypothetical protein